MPIPTLVLDDEGADDDLCEEGLDNDDDDELQDECFDHDEP